nr:MAG TPA: hypothetical protein [Caudoviricetes sp.]
MIMVMFCLTSLPQLLRLRPLLSSGRVNGKKGLY